MPHHTRGLAAPCLDQTLTEWSLFMRGARMAKVTISERVRIVRAFADDMATDPLTAAPEDVSEWISLHDEWSQHTVCAYWSALSAFYKWAMLYEKCDASPLTRLMPPRQPERSPRPVSDVAVQRLLSMPMRGRSRRMILLAVCQGLRVHEIAKVHSKHFSEDGTELTVKGKGGKVAQLPMHELVRAEWKQQPAGWWFKSPYGDKPIQARSCAQVITRQMRKAGINGTPHQLRHFYGSRLLADGADLRVVQELMRHSSIQTTVQYTKVPDRFRRDAIAKFDPMSSAFARQDRAAELPLAS